MKQDAIAQLTRGTPIMVSEPLMMNRRAGEFVYFDAPCNRVVYRCSNANIYLGVDPAHVTVVHDHKDIAVSHATTWITNKMPHINPGVVRMIVEQLWSASWRPGAGVSGAEESGHG